jgi:hypothetical protein
LYLDSYTGPRHAAGRMFALWTHATPSLTRSPSRCASAQAADLSRVAPCQLGGTAHRRGLWEVPQQKSRRTPAVVTTADNGTGLRRELHGAAQIPRRRVRRLGDSRRSMRVCLCVCVFVCLCVCVFVLCLRLPLPLCPVCCAADVRTEPASVLDGINIAQEESEVWRARRAPRICRSRLPA